VDALGYGNSVFFSSLAFQSNKKSTLIEDPESAVFGAGGGRLKINLRHPLFPHLYRQIFFYNHIYGALSKQSPSILIFAEGTSHYDYLSASAAKALSIPTVRIQSGRAGILHSGYRNMNFDSMLCWSEDFVERYRQVSPLPEYKVVGSPTIDEFIQLKQTAKSDPQTVLFITQPVSQYISEADYQLLLNVARELLMTSAECSLIVRHHPVDKHEGFDKLIDMFPGRVKKMNSPDYSLARTLAESDCAAGFFSTAISEAAACGVIPIIVQTRKSQSVYPFPEKHNAAIVTSDADEATQELLNVLEKPQEYDAMKLAMKQFSSRFFGPADGKAMQRTVFELKRLARVAGEQGIG
jgi:glycosyltransferase involved in cell wall biosynthesis